MASVPKFTRFGDKRKIVSGATVVPFRLIVPVHVRVFVLLLIFHDVVKPVDGSLFHNSTVTSSSTWWSIPLSLNQALILW